MSYDGVLNLERPLKRGLWTQPAAMLRGGFRYLTVVSTAPGVITISNISVAISFAPHFADLRNYSGYFFAKDPVFHDPNFLIKVRSPSDMGVAVPTQFVSTNDLLPARNALSTMFSFLDPRTGALPESGPPLLQTGSDTYHMWTLIGVHNYFLYSGDVEWLQDLWSNYTKAVGFVLGKVDQSGLMNVTGLRDWARLGGGGHNAEGNALLYKVCY
ncbi:hypothetical protein EIP86_000062 [Pleurotus ostreatoroseus]|nr:hypothetical protein EIP86_000062 [Pleurotus ostreatoroseus]